jgi:hypothetical protein
MKHYHANDWVKINKNTKYSKERNVYWHKNRIYCPLSAAHNGIIGVGAQLKAILNEEK